MLPRAQGNARERSSGGREEVEQRIGPGRNETTSRDARACCVRSVRTKDFQKYAQRTLQRTLLLISRVFYARAFERTRLTIRAVYSDEAYPVPRGTRALFSSSPSPAYNRPGGCFRAVSSRHVSRARHVDVRRGFPEKLSRAAGLGLATRRHERARGEIQRLIFGVERSEFPGGRRDDGARVKIRGT